MSQSGTDLYEAAELLLSDASPKPRWDLKSADEIAAKPVEFLWNPYLPIGEVTVIMAAGGTGKTFALCGIAAELSNGRFPCNGIDTFEPVHTLFISAEDRGSIFRERLEAAQANLRCIHILDDAASVGLNLADSAGDELIDLIKSAGAKLVVIDPLHAFVGDIDLNRVNIVRPVMHRLAAIAKACACSIVIVSHVSKRTADGNANNLALGSVDIINASRSVLRVTGDETGTNPNRRVLVQTKSNYAAYGASLAFALCDDGIRWLGFSPLTRELLEGALQSKGTLAQYLNQMQLNVTQAEPILDALLSLVASQDTPKAFYAYKSLRKQFPACFGTGYIKPILDRVRLRLKEKGVSMEFTNAPHPDRFGQTDRGVYLTKLFDG